MQKTQTKKKRILRLKTKHTSKTIQFSALGGYRSATVNVISEELAEKVGGKESHATRPAGARFFVLVVRWQLLLSWPLLSKDRGENVFQYQDAPVFLR